MTDREKLIDLLYDSNVNCNQGIERLADDIMDILFQYYRPVKEEA